MKCGRSRGEQWVGRGKAGALDKGAEATLCVLDAYLRVRIVPLVRLWAVVEFNQGSGMMRFVF